MFSRTFSSLGTRRRAASALTVAILAAVMAVVGAGTLTLNTRTVAGAGGGGCFSTGGPVCTFKDHVASAGFGTVSADGCIFTEAFVAPFESLTSPGNVATTDVFVAVSKYNGCTNTLLEQAINFDPATGNPVFNGTVQFGPRLDTATVSGSAPMFDAITGAPLFTSTINLTWQGFGPLTTFIDGSHVRMPGFLVNTHSLGSSREAKASGAVSDENGTNFATQPSLKSDLEVDTSGTVQLSHS
jgi:hypothetical protein